MRTYFQQIKPCSQVTLFSNENTIRVINKSHRNIPSRTISHIVNKARKVHQKYKKPQTSMPVYTRGECYNAILDLRQEFPDHIIKTIMGLKVPGSKGRPPGFPEDSAFGLHHVAELCFDGLSIVVDTTIAQLHEADPKLANTEALIIISESGKVFENIRNIYGGNWGDPIGGF